MKWIDKFTATGLQSVLIDDRGRERAFVTTRKISSRGISGYGFMVGKSSAGMHSDFLTARGICERIIQLKASHGRA